MATNQIKLSTTGTQDPVTFDDLGGRVFNHPTVDFDLLSEYSLVDLLLSTDLRNAFSNGWITLKDYNDVVAERIEDIAFFNAKDNFTATVAPVSTNDKTEGYSFGSRWTNINTNETWLCISNTKDNAIWIQPLTFGKFTIKDEGVNVANTPHVGIDFVGTGIVATDQGSGIAQVEAIFGAEYQTASSESTSSTTATSKQTKLIFDVTNVPSGDYIIEWYCEVRQSTINYAIEVDSRLDGTIIGKVRFYNGNDDDDDDSSSNDWSKYWRSFSGHKIVSLNGSHTFKLRYKAVFGGVAYIRRARMTMWRVA